MATTKLGAGGAVSIFTSAQADVVVDVVGYVHPTQGSLFNAVTPSRVHDVRPTRLVAGQEVTIPVRGVGTVPGSAGVTGAVLNLTVNAPRARGSSPSTRGLVARAPARWPRTSTTSRARPSPTPW